jgi:hypothetical protein
MIEEFLMPLDRHFDAGFGATADSFHDAAKALDTEEHKHGFGLNSSRLPVFYLYRHANELYLKSLLTMLHRRFCCEFPVVKRDDFPLITVHGTAKRVFQVHSILHLYPLYSAIVTDVFCNEEDGEELLGSFFESLEVESYKPKSQNRIWHAIRDFCDLTTQPYPADEIRRQFENCLQKWVFEDRFWVGRNDAQGTGEVSFDEDGDSDDEDE